MSSPAKIDYEMRETREKGSARAGGVEPRMNANERGWGKSGGRVEDGSRGGAESAEKRLWMARISRIVGRALGESEDMSGIGPNDSTEAQYPVASRAWVGQLSVPFLDKF